jgi:HSP20 family protein
MWWNTDPWRELERMRSELDRIFNGNAAPMASRAYPLMNMYDSNDAVVVTAELPGMSREQVNITFTDGILSISGKRKGEDFGGMALVRQERSSSDFEKSVKIPSRVESDRIAATLRDGILMVTLPKAEEAKPKEISINVH